MIENGLIGRYLVDCQLGTGGMGEVLLAYSPAGDPVAVKLIRSDRLDPVTRARFEKEALIARTVVGTSRVARFLDADPHADRPWLAVEYVPGVTLAAHVEAHGPLPAPLVVSLGALLAEGLEAVHAAGLLHRDVKPQNVMMGEHGPVLIDFGLGAFLDPTADTLSQSGMVIGTVRYMPPEQAGGKVRVTPAADVYGLGAVLLYAATGHHPYDGSRWEAILGQVRDPDRGPDLGGLPGFLVPLIGGMLVHDPGARPSLADITTTCTELFATLQMTPAHARHALIDRTAPGRPPPPPPLPHDAADDDVPERHPSVDTSDDVAVAEPTPAPVGARRTASQRVADDLRERYAIRAALYAGR